MTETKTDRKKGSRAEQRKWVRLSPNCHWLNWGCQHSDRTSDLPNIETSIMEWHPLAYTGHANFPEKVTAHVTMTQIKPAW